MIKTWLKCGGVVLVMAIGLMAGGCSSQITPDSVRADMSPEMETIQYTHQQRCNNIARSIDTTTRQIHDDWDRIWLVDQPLHLSYIPIP
ncbi:MAG: hypothetical protein WD768_16660 [Phycisphaeraceae bacterium]